MDGFFTSPFLSKFPNNLKASIYEESSSYYNLFTSMKKGYFLTGVDKGNFINVLKKLKKDEPELFKLFISLESSGKIKTREVENGIINDFKDIKIRKSILGQISSGYAQKTHSVFHDAIDDPKKKQSIIQTGGKPLIDHTDVQSGKIDYFFHEKSFPQILGEKFNWSRFLSNYIYPFKRVRILDPYLYTNVNDIDLNNMLRSLLKLSKPEHLSIEIISDLGADNRRKKEEVLQKVSDELSLPSLYDDCLTLYSQKGSASSIFHKRVIWTDFWVLLAERGLDFTKLQTGQGVVKKENTLYLTGRYSSNDSLWHQVDNNWDEYLSKSEKILL